MDPSRNRARLALLAALASLSAASARADEVRVPIALDPPLLEHGLESRVFTEPGGAARIWDDGHGCNLLLLRHPRVSMRGDSVRIVADVEAHVGTPVFDDCLFGFEWRGVLEAIEAPSLDRERSSVVFRVTDSKLLETDGTESLAPSVLWDWIKADLPPRLETVTVDLSGTLATLRQALPLFLSNAPPDRVRGVVDSLALEDLRTTDAGLELTLRLSLPPPAAPAPSTAPAPALSDEERTSLDNAAQRFDAFLTVVLRQAGGDAADAGVRRELLEALLDARLELVDALASPSPAAEDPVRRIFFRSWERVTPTLRKLDDEVPGDGGLRYLSLVTAADALRALDALGAVSGFEISADGLRRLARVVTPASEADPLRYELDVDPRLRSALGFGPPLPEPEDVPESEPEPAPPAPRSGLWPAALRLFAAFAVGEAHAAEVNPLGDVPAGISREQLRRLDRWVPRPNELDVYLPLMRDLLQAVAAERLSADSLDGHYAPIFPPLVLATAWQETCWRQFVRVGGQVRAIRSRRGSVGLMQINTRVWRGFYSVPSLERHTSYNARAGSEILMRYLRDDVIGDREPPRGGSADDVARAAYSVYNGGPSTLRRAAPASRRERGVSSAFLEKFRAVRGGQDLAVAACFGGE